MPYFLIVFILIRKDEKTSDTNCSLEVAKKMCVVRHSNFVGNQIFIFFSSEQPKTKCSWSHNKYADEVFLEEVTNVSNPLLHH